MTPTHTRLSPHNTTRHNLSKKANEPPSCPTIRVKGIGSEQTIDSQVLIHTTGEGEQMRITKVEDKWDGEIKQGGLKNALRELNSKTVPVAVSVPKSVEEEEQSGK
jgi:hypothetical protein